LLLYIGGAFAPAGSVRSGYIELSHRKNGSGLEQWSGSWDQLGRVLRQFIWSSKAFDSQVGEFWQEVRSHSEDKVVYQSIEES